VEAWRQDPWSGEPLRDVRDDPWFDPDVEQKD